MMMVILVMILVMMAHDDDVSDGDDDCDGDEYRRTTPYMMDLMVWSEGNHESDWYDSASFYKDGDSGGTIAMTNLSWTGS